MDVSRWPWKAWFSAGAANAAVGSVGLATAVACSSSTACAAADGGVLDAAKSRSDGSSGSASSQPLPSQPACPGPVGSPVGPTWKPPATGAPTACSVDDIAAIKTLVDSSTTTFTDLFKGIPSDRCRACVFSNSGDSQWQLAVWDPDMTSGNAFVNVGACYALAAGGSAACGAGVQDDQFCLGLACADTCTDLAACNDSANASVCKDEFAEMNASCGTQLTQLDAQCDTFVDDVKIVCGDAPADGGSDAAADASGDAPDEGG
jgi:hypothetical protein